MLRIYSLLAAHIFGVRDAINQRIDTRSEDGLGTLEMVIIALGLFTLAGLAIGVLTGAVQSRLNQIN